MTVIVRRVVRHRAQRETVFINVVGVVQERHDEIATAHVMRQIAEKMAAVWIVAEVLNNRAAVCISLRRAQFFGSSVGKSRQQGGFQPVFPSRINDRLVGEHGVRARDGRAREHRNQK